MNTVASEMIGYAPIVVVSNIRPPEKQIYEQMWKTPEYRAVAPGEHLAEEFLKQAKPKKGAKVIDLGCGTGRGSLMLAVFGGLDVTMVDFAKNCLDDDIKPMLETQKHVMRFVEADLTKRLELDAEYGFCTDVMEHIPPEQVDRVLDNCLMACHHVYFNISTVDDRCGKLIGHELHLTVQPYEWWLQKFNDRDCVIHWSAKKEDSCSFYVTAWQSGAKITEYGVLNTEVDKIKENVRHNIKQGYTQVTPFETNEVEVMILGGGPTMNGFVEEIRQKREDGVKLICLNGTYQWALDHGLKPSALVMVDAREFNARFTRNPVDGCKYFLASQCDPTAFEGLPKERIMLWHTTTEMIKEVLNEEYKTWWGIPGGSTVLLRAIPLFRLLGFKKFHLYGCDSCFVGNKHHSYSQPENDGDVVFPVTVGGRIFQCNLWMASQAQEFMDLIKFMGDELQIATYGDGLLNWILESGAKAFDEEVLD